MSSVLLMGARPAFALISAEWGVEADPLDKYCIVAAKRFMTRVPLKFALVVVGVASHATNIHAQTACPTDAKFVYQVAVPVRQVAAEARVDGAPTLDVESGKKENVVRFIVDTAGKAEPGTLKKLAVQDSALFARFSIALRQMRFEPASLKDGCRVRQVVMGTLSWPKPGQR